MARLTRCKTCGAEVATSARRCPQCGAKLKHHRFLKFLLILALIIILFVCYRRGAFDGLLRRGGSNSTQTDVVATLMQTPSTGGLTSRVTTAPTDKSSSENGTAATASTKSPAGKSTQAPTDVPTDAPTKVPTEAPTQAPTPEPTEFDGVRQEVKDFWDSYESFMNEYVDFMTKYDSANPLQAIKYAEMVGRYIDMAYKGEKYDETHDLNKAEEAYGEKVMLRVTDMLVKAAVELPD